MQIVEVGPRDGLQNEKVVLDVRTRVRYIEHVVASGARRIEAVSFARPDRVPQMAGAEEVMAAVPRVEGVAYSGLVMNPRGVDRAIAAGIDEANIVLVATDEFSRRNQGMTVAESLAVLPKMVERLVDAGIPTTVTIGAAFGCPFEGEVPVARIAELTRAVSDLPISELALADTIGVGVPRDVRDRVTAARDEIDVPMRLHLHNTRNTGYANALTAVEMGVEVLDASTGGIGGCPFAPAATGNIATEDLLYALKRSGHEVSQSLDGVLAATRFITEALGILPPALLGRAGDFPS
ncbi:hydroxymethylglutaryl-CoA lyase [Microbacterium invictum]|uniref:Hydroxymethylglutaryl-CoA lyase n=1 Tax=Microbacterium invictum TaxID=515415 RepID=A0ABZ0VBU3_9MICO|nr:hydroxymethylglutaryl-CoA lyase [Microbacterium invictum]WQB71098.1 hydroxymethylglutaryl-CoA lyase [Microbacterium invictum]